ncbi:MAG: TIGR02452 family protein [Caldilineales bacterium]
MGNKEMARETVEILDRGHYRSPGGRQVDLSAALAACVANTGCYDPEQVAGIRDQVLAQPAGFVATVLEVANETTLQGAARLAASGHYARIGALNFASARNPGGGFLSGAQAQEESLARSSGLYHSLLACPSYYRYHRNHRSGLYSDRMIHSPGCPVFRSDDGALLEEAILVDFITSPAPNAGAIRHNSPNFVGKIEPVLRDRASKVLGLAAHHRCDGLVLGAWGCGVFRNDPAMVAGAFRDLLAPDGPFWGRFSRVLFSVLDRSQDQRTYNAFRERFAA